MQITFGSSILSTEGLLSHVCFSPTRPRISTQGSLVRVYAVAITSLLPQKFNGKGATNHHRFQSGGISTIHTGLINCSRRPRRHSRSRYQSGCYASKGLNHKWKDGEKKRERGERGARVAGVNSDV